MNSLFNNKSFPIKAAPVVVRTERVRGPPKSVSTLSDISTENSKTRREKKNLSSKTDQLKSSKTDAHNFNKHKVDQNTNRKRPKLAQKRSTAQHQPLISDTSDSESSIELASQNPKRQKITELIDNKRKLLLEDAFIVNDAINNEIIHAADIISAYKSFKKKPSEDFSDFTTVDLQYPSISEPERYVLVFGNDFNPAGEIITVVKSVLDFYIAEDYTNSPKVTKKEIARKVTKAYNLLSRDFTNKDLLSGFKRSIEVYNLAIDEWILDGVFSRTLDAVHIIPLFVVECILQQVYVRAVSPKVEILKKYENGSDNVYGELLPPFISKILRESGLKSDSIFVDLGSGVGNVVLQAALEFGCESWGCEMMENAFTLAEAQKAEFGARCRLWGIKTGLINLERGDFLENQKIHTVMQKADVILVNNQAFTPDLNQKLKDLFLDLKDGCRIISLKSFVPNGHQISTRNLWDPANLFDITEGEYHSRSVSWTDAGGKYYIAKKDETRLMKFKAR